MNRVRFLLFWLLLAVSGLYCPPALAAYDLEVPADPWDEYRLQFKTYSRHLLASYDLAFVDDYDGAIREVDRAIELLPEEGIGYAERGKYYRMINDPARAEADFKKALLLFERALVRYRPVAGNKKRKKAVRKVDPAEAARLIATLHYQRGEAYFSFEHYRQASDDFKIACRGGSSAACSRMGDVTAIEKRGSNWVPISALQFYDRQRLEYSPGDLVRVWVRREDSLSEQGEAGPELHIQQQLELKCSTREFRLLEDPAAPKSGLPVKRKSAVPLFSKPAPGSAPGKLLTLLCARPPLK